MFGQSNDIENRFKQHKYLLRENKHFNKYLQNSWNKNREESFSFEISQFCLNEQLTWQEQATKDYFSKMTGVYNFGDCVSPSMKGMKHSFETKQKMSLAKSGEKHPMFGKHLSEESKQKMSLARFGKCLSEESKQKISLANFGKCLSEETKQKISLARTGEKHPMFGKHLSEESKQKISLARLGKHHSEETKQKIRAFSGKSVKRINRITR